MPVPLSPASHVCSGVHGASGGAQRGYSENATLGLGREPAAGLGPAKSEERSAPSTSGGGGKPARAAICFLF
jgi:hypothetical protein